MRGAAPRTIYESSARRARRRSRRLFAAALAVLVLAAGGGTAALVLWRDGGAQAGPRPAALTPSAPASTAELLVVAPLPPAFPGRKAVARALDWAGGRAGEVGVAVVDSRGEVTGLHAHATFEGASLVKAMLLVAYLRARPAVDPALDGVATTMIAESDNASAYTIYGVVGGKGLKRVATLSGMEDFEPGAGWLDSRVSAADQARFFFDLERYVPAGRRAFARRLLTGITAMQRWGIPAAAGPEGWQTFFKGGWLGMDNRLMLQAAWLERGQKRWALAVMTDDNPDRAYGWDTQKGVAGLLLGEEPTPAYLATVLE
jgi:Beta-lactamase enzyme family